MDLRDIHTKLSWSRKQRKASSFKQTELNDITQILSEEQLGEDGPVRILIEGTQSLHLCTISEFVAVCLAVGKEWEEKQRKVDLRDIHTKLSWSRKQRKASSFKQTELNDITQILSEEQLGEDGPVRILIEGTQSLHLCTISE